MNGFLQIEQQVPKTQGQWLHADAPTQVLLTLKPNLLPGQSFEFGIAVVAGGTHDLAPWWEMPLMQGLAWGGRHLFRLDWMQQRMAQTVSDRTHATMQQFAAESPIPVEPAPYDALRIFWGYNFFTRRSGRWHLDFPALIVSGGQDPMFTYDMGEALVSHFPKGQHLHLAAAGHLVMAEYPDRINQALAEFWQQAAFAQSTTENRER